MSHRGKKKTRSMLEQLRKEAGERQAEYDKLTLQQKLDRLPAEPHAAKQRARLLAQKTTAFVKSVNQGVKDVEEGNTLPHEEVKKNLKAKERRAQEKK